MFILLVIIYILILLIAIFGNITERELNKHREDWKRIIGEEYK